MERVMKINAATDPDRPSYRVHMKNPVMWLGRNTALAYDMNARPYLLMAMLLVLLLGILGKNIFLALPVVALLYYVDTKRGLFPYKPRSQWSEFQEDAYARLAQQRAKKP